MTLDLAILSLFILLLYVLRILDRHWDDTRQWVSKAFFPGKKPAPQTNVTSSPRTEYPTQTAPPADAPAATSLAGPSKTGETSGRETSGSDSSLIQVHQPAMTAAAGGERVPTVTPSALAYRIILARGVLPIIHDYVTSFLHAQGPDKEAGGMLVGAFTAVGADGVPTFTIAGFVDAGPKAKTMPGSILFDNEYQSQQLQVIQLQHPTTENVGCIHLQPGDMDQCSHGDQVSDHESVKRAGTQALVFAIITIDNPRQNPQTVRYQDFNFDFYVMAHATDGEYLPISPVLADLPVIEVSPALAQLAVQRAPQAPFDLAVLRSLKQIRRASFRQVDTASTGGLLLSFSAAELAEQFHILTAADGSLRLFLEADGRACRLPGPWEQPEVGSHVWLSHLALLALAQPRVGANGAVAYGCHCAWWREDKQRLMAEVRAMEERYGDRAKLQRRGDQLYWTVDIYQSGRCFPVEIRYPDEYPNEPPHLVSVRELPASPHKLSASKLCWIDHITSNSPWNPARDTAATAAAAAHRWFACLLVYLTLGHWP